MDSIKLLEALMVLVPMILSLTVHEFAHAASAKALGDNTAEGQGRLTLNPIVHIDVIGTLVLPMALLLFGGGFFFGWAKPVPVNPSRFRRSINMRTGMMLTAAAGPLSNLLLAIIARIALNFVSAGEWGATLLERALMINVALFLFNMIPFYPLDGQKVLAGLLPSNAAVKFERLSAQYGQIGLIVVIFAGGRFLAAPFYWVVTTINSVFG